LHFQVEQFNSTGIVCLVLACFSSHHVQMTAGE